MSSVAKGIGKTFKKVAKVAKKVAPIVLAAAAIYFTAGAALGVAGAAGGWGSVAGGLTQSLGLTGSTLGNVLTGAVTQAGYGAAIGAATSAITGGDIAKGALYGAASGAVTGGISGGLGFGTDPLGASTAGDATVPTGTPAPAAPTPQVTGTPANPMASITGDVLPSDGGVGPAVGGGPASAGARVATTAATSAGTGGGGFFDKGGWLERNQTLAGSAIKGLGGGLLQGMAAKDEAAAYEKRQQQIAGNYRTGGRGLMTQQPQAATYDASGNPTPEQKYGGRVPTGSTRMRYQWNPQAGRVELVRVPA